MVMGSNVLDENGFCILKVAEIICVLLVLTRQFLPYLSTAKSRTKIGRAGSGPEFHAIFQSGRVKKIEPTSNSGLNQTENSGGPAISRHVAKRPSCLTFLGESFVGLG